MVNPKPKQITTIKNYKQGTQTKQNKANPNPRQKQTNNIQSIPNVQNITNTNHKCKATTIASKPKQIVTTNKSQTKHTT